MTRVLVIEDNDVLRNLIERMLVKAGHQVLVASGSLNALRLWESRQVDLVVTDIGLPGRSGIETLIDMRALRPNLPIVVISGQGHGDLVNLIKGAGLMDGVQIITKPFAIVELNAAVQVALLEPPAKDRSRET